MSRHQHFLHLALHQAQIRRGFCTPNPSVGAVIVKDNQVLATGYHWAAGYAHAEVDALQKLPGNEAQGATLYVTLEPCCHFGKTPPCTQIIAEKGIKEVVYGFQDPNPLVAGLGHSTLQKMGIDCHLLSLATITHFYRSYNHWWQNKRPWVTGKLAVSLDGKIAAKEGERAYITGDELQAYTHQHRKQADAILTTAKTIYQDNPQLNVRLASEIISKPIYILDSELSLAKFTTAVIFKTAEKITLFHRSNINKERLQTLKEHNVNCIAVGTDKQGLNLQEVLEKIGEHGIHELWVEAGGRCFQTLLAQKLLQRVFIYMAPKILGTKAIPAFNSNEDLFAAAKNFHWQDFGKDVLCKIEF